MLGSNGGGVGGGGELNEEVWVVREVDLEEVALDGVGLMVMVG